MEFSYSIHWVSCVFQHNKYHFMGAPVKIYLFTGSEKKFKEFSWQKRPVMIIIMYILLALFNKPIKYICML